MCHGVDATSSHNKCEYTTNEEEKFQNYSYLVTLMKIGISGQLMSPKNIGFVIQIMDEPKIHYAFIASIYDKA